MVFFLQLHSPYASVILLEYFQHVRYIVLYLNLLSSSNSYRYAILLLIQQLIIPVLLQVELADPAKVLADAEEQLAVPDD